MHFNIVQTNIFVKKRTWKSYLFRGNRCDIFVVLHSINICLYHQDTSVFSHLVFFPLNSLSITALRRGWDGLILYLCPVPCICITGVQRVFVFPGTVFHRRHAWKTSLRNMKDINTNILAKHSEEFSVFEKKSNWHFPCYQQRFFASFVLPFGNCLELLWWHEIIIPFRNFFSVL